MPIDLWDSSKKKAKGTSALSRQINFYLEEVNSQIFQIYQDLKYKGELITAELVKAHYTGGTDDQGKSLMDIIKYHNAKTANTLAPGSIRNFGVTESYVQKFLKKHRKTSDVYLKQLNFEFLTDFQGYLSNLYPAGHPKALSPNTVMKHIQRFRKIVTLAYNLEWMKDDLFRRLKWSFNKVDPEFLSNSELSKLAVHQFQIDRLDRVRNLFVFSCYTGISFVDIKNLTNKNVWIGGDEGNRWIATGRRKTNTKIT